jgi:hypothetical protein
MGKNVAPTSMRGLLVVDDGNTFGHVVLEADDSRR